jgi:hypothetical protein
VQCQATEHRRRRGTATRHRAARPAMRQFWDRPDGERCICPDRDGDVLCLDFRPGAVALACCIVPHLDRTKNTAWTYNLSCAFGRLRALFDDETAILFLMVRQKSQQWEISSNIVLILAIYVSTYTQYRSLTSDTLARQSTFMLIAQCINVPMAQNWRQDIV